MTIRRPASGRLSPLLRPIVAVMLVATVAACGGGPTPTPPRTPAQGPTQGPSTPAASAASPATPAITRSPVPFDPTGLSVGFETVVEGLSEPLAVANAGDGSGRIFVVEQGGRIRIVRDGTLVGRPFLDISDRIAAGGERGLLGLAFHPDYPDDPRLFVDYTDTNGDTRVTSFRVDPSDPDRVDPASEVGLLFVAQPFANHNGGAVAFGPDGYLYISTGDGGSGGDPQGNGQSLRTLLAKILRIDVDRTEADRQYAIPPDNPFVAEPDVAPETWLSGLRNPWRLSFDGATGDLWIGDVGQGAWEEIDVARAGVGGLNFGWNRMEGSHCYGGGQGCEDPAFTLPVAEYGHDVGCTVIGGVVYRGSAQPALAGGYLFADYCSGLVWAIDPATDGPREPTLVDESGLTFSAFGEDEVGELYATELRAGTLLRVTGAR